MSLVLNPLPSKNICQEMKVKRFFKPTKAERIHPYPTDWREMLKEVSHIQWTVSHKKE